jgi:hypothetical protein
VIAGPGAVLRNSALGSSYPAISADADIEPRVIGYSSSIDLRVAPRISSESSSSSTMRASTRAPTMAEWAAMAARRRCAAVVPGEAALNRSILRRRTRINSTRVERCGSISRANTRQSQNNAGRARPPRPHGASIALPELPKDPKTSASPSLHQGFAEPSRTLGPAFMRIAADLRSL